MVEPGAMPRVLRILGLALMTGYGCAADDEGEGEGKAVDTSDASDSASSTDGSPIDSPEEELVFDELSDEEPRCYELCARDLASNFDLVQPKCTVVEVLGGDYEMQFEVRACGEDTTNVPNPSLACYRLRSDVEGLTRTDNDDLHPLCRDAGSNIQFEIVFDLHQPPPDNTEYHAGCELSAEPAVDCPLLPTGD